jgi:hypothetical protein
MPWELLKPSSAGVACGLIVRNVQRVFGGAFRNNGVLAPRAAVSVVCASAGATQTAPKFSPKARAAPSTPIRERPGAAAAPCVPERDLLCARDRLPPGVE